MARLAVCSEIGAGGEGGDAAGGVMIDEKLLEEAFDDAYDDEEDDDEAFSPGPSGVGGWACFGNTFISSHIRMDRSRSSVHYCMKKSKSRLICIAEIWSYPTMHARPTQGGGNATRHGVEA